MPQVSVIIPTYNRADLLPRAIRSVLGQTCQDLELIVVDDGSTDETREVVERFTDERVRYIWQENQERSVARNTGIQASQGNYVSFLDSDDEYLPHKLAVQVPILDRNSKVGMVLSGWLETDDRGNVLRERSPWLVYPDQGIDLRTWLLSGPVYFGATTIRRDWLEQIGGFDAGMTGPEDVDLLFRLVRAGCRTAWAESHVLKLRRHSASLESPIRYRRNYLRLLDKAFSDPELAGLIGVSKDQASAVVYLVTACQAYLCGQIGEARDSLFEAGCLDPALLAGGADRTLNSIVSWAWRPLNDDPVGYITRVFDNLPSSFQGLRRRRRWALARAWMAVAFRAHRRRERGVVRTAVLQTVLRDPGAILNRGIISIWFESWVGSRVARGIKSAVHRLRAL